MCCLSWVHFPTNKVHWSLFKNGFKKLHLGKSFLHCPACFVYFCFFQSSYVSVQLHYFALKKSIHANVASVFLSLRKVSAPAHFIMASWRTHPNSTVCCTKNKKQKTMQIYIKQKCEHINCISFYLGVQRNICFPFFSFFIDKLQAWESFSAEFACSFCASVGSPASSISPKTSKWGQLEILNGP